MSTSTDSRNAPPESGERRIPAEEFRAGCLALLDEVGVTGQAIIITKGGRAVARLEPLEGHQRAPLLGSVLAEPEIVAPLDDVWDAEL